MNSGFKESPDLCYRVIAQDFKTDLLIYARWNVLISGNFYQLQVTKMEALIDRDSFGFTF